MLFSREKKQDAKQNKGPSILGYMFNPRLGEDVKPVGEALSMFVFLLAAVFSSCGLFPKNHPAFLDKSGKFRLSMGEVLATGWNSFTFTKKDFPRAVMYFAVLGCVLFSVLFVVTYLVSLLIPEAHAAENMFTPPQDFDWGTAWVDYLFRGISFDSPLEFGTSVPTNSRWQIALGAAMMFYSNAILVLAGFILLYYLVAMVAETAQYGVAMGKRANQLWAPIRLVFAIGLLVPISTASSGGVYGYNSGQYIVMQVAKWGSGLASNVWKTFGTKLLLPESSPSDCRNSGSPSCVKRGDLVDGLVHNMIENYSCVYLLNYNYLEAGLYSDSPLPTGIERIKNLKGYISNLIDGVAYRVEDSVSGDVGEHFFGVKQLGFLGNIQNPESQKVCGGYIIPKVPADSPYRDVAQAQVEVFVDYLDDMQAIAQKYALCYAKPDDPDVCDSSEREMINEKAQELTKTISNEINRTVERMIPEKDRVLREKLVEALEVTGGWMSAGSFYNTLARIAGQRAESKRDVLPAVVRPDIWNKHRKVGQDEWGAQYIRDTKTVNTAEHAVRGSLDKINAVLKGGVVTPSDFNPGRDRTAHQDSDIKIPQLMKGTIGFREAKALFEGGVSNVFFTTVYYTLRYAGLWEDSASNGKGHLAIRFDNKRDVWTEVIAFGQRVLDAAGYFFNATAILVLLKDADTGILASIIPIFFMAGAAFFAAGGLLTFVLPLHPFFRFFFGALTWIVSVCEAIVAVPLWALAHINPSGDGLPGDKALKGYYMLLHIFLRPVLMVIGLIIAYLLFNIAVSFLNSAFILAAQGSTTTTLKSFNYLPEIIYSIMYCILVYSCGNLCFKTIGAFPQRAMNWFGTSMPEEPMGDKTVSGVMSGTIGALLGKEAMQHFINAGAAGTNLAAKKVGNVIGATASGVGAVAGAAGTAAVGTLGAAAKGAEAAGKAMINAGKNIKEKRDEKKSSKKVEKEWGSNFLKDHFPE